MSRQPKLLLFDIDGTLITSGGAGEQALADAVNQTFGRDSALEGVEIAGRTDSAIARAILENLGVDSSPENQRILLDAYLFNLERRLGERQGRVLPGILPLLEHARERPHLTLALLTGNLLRGAELKLTHYGLWRYFEFGAFADDHHDRNALGPVARERARIARGVSFDPGSIYVIGDTPHDIACGRAIDAVTVAVATGSYTRDQLAAHQPHHLFEDFSDLHAVSAAIEL